MIKLNEQINYSLSLNHLWKIQEFHNWISKIEKLGYNISFWENEENWATIMDNGEIIGYLWYQNPLLIIQSSDLICTISNTELEEIQIIYHIDFNEKIFFLDKDNLKYSEFSLLNNPFSINDLWFMTNML